MYVTESLTKRLIDFYHYKLVFKFLRIKHRCGHIKAELTWFAICPQMSVVFESSPEFIRKVYSSKLQIFCWLPEKHMQLPNKQF